MYWLYESEIKRCLLCNDAPCSKACPDKLDPAKRIRSLYFNNDYSEIILHSDDDITNKLINNMMELFYDLSKQYPKDIIVKEI